MQKVNNSPSELEKDFKPVKKYFQMMLINLNNQMNREDNVCKKPLLLVVWLMNYLYSWACKKAVGGVMSLFKTNPTKDYCKWKLIKIYLGWKDTKETKYTIKNLLKLKKENETIKIRTIRDSFVLLFSQFSYCQGWLLCVCNRIWW